MNNNHTVLRNTNTVSDSDARARAPLGTIPIASWYNSSLPLSSAPSPCQSVCNPVPRNNLQQKEGTTQVHNEASGSSLPPKRKRDRKHRKERRARERENNIESFIHDARWANQRSLVPASSSVPVRVTQSVPQAVDPISSMRTAVYPPLESVGNSTANENSPFQIGLESSRNLGLYKPTAPDPNQDTWAYNSVANSSELGPPSPTRTFVANSSGSGNRTGIIYPLQPYGRRPDVCIEVEASLPEPVALYALTYVNLRVLRSRRKLLQTFHEPTGDLVASDEGIAQQRYSVQPNAHLHGGIGVTKKYKQIKIRSDASINKAAIVTESYKQVK